MSAINGKTPPARPIAGGVQSYSDSNRAWQYTEITHCLEAFRQFIRDKHGVELLGDLVADNAIHGLQTSEDKPGRKPFRYCVHLDPPQNVYYYDHKRGFSGTWYPDGREPIDPSDRLKQRQKFEALRVQREAKERAKHEKTAELARALWKRSFIANPAHAYLEKKGVGVHGVRCLPSWENRILDKDGAFKTVAVKYVLLVPMKDQSGEIWNVQAIFPETCPELGRDKDFLAGGRKKGLLHWIGERTETVCIAEGYATGASIHEATGYRVFVAFDAGCLPLAAQTVRAKLPDARIVLCADHDEPDKYERRIGIEKAHEAAALVGGFVALPPVEGDDFNDWAAKLKAGNHG